MDQHHVVDEYDLLLCQSQISSDLFPNEPKILLLRDKTPHVMMWQDFSNKYGMNYQLSNGSVGEVYNDMTFLVESPNSLYFDYFDRDVAKWLRVRSAHLAKFVNGKKIMLHQTFKQRMELTVQMDHPLRDCLDILVDKLMEAFYENVKCEEHVKVQFTKFQYEQRERLMLCKSFEEVLALPQFEHPFCVCLDM